MPQRIRKVLVLTILVLIPSISGAEAIEGPLVSRLPLLWNGQVVGLEGDPVNAHLTAFIRPPASVIPAADSGIPAPPSIPLASTTTDGTGAFELRAAPPAVPSGYRPDGWLHVMILATAADGSWMVANDSMRYIPTPGGAQRGTWLSTTTAEERLRSLLAAPILPKASLVNRLVLEDLNNGVERPNVLQLVQPGPRAAGGPGANRWVGPGDPYIGCSALAVEGREDGFRTIADIDVGPSWSFELDYTDTRTTSWDIGVEGSQGRWKAGGTTSFSNSLSAGFTSEFGPYPGRFRESYQVKLVHAKVLWRCASRTSPGPFYIRTVEPESWTGGTFNQGEPIIPCNPKQREPVAGNTTGWRKKEKASKYSASAAAFGFIGQAAVTYSDDIKLGWHNFLGAARDVCGESGHPYRGNTRVAAMDEHR